jgi:hypothetical protein
MKTIAYTALHYGRDYLGFAIKSVIDYVDEYWVLYSAIGSHGFRTATPCPETRAELYTIAQAVAGDKLHWVDGEWAHEGLQRESITEHCPDADVILVLDADEIWGNGLVEQAIEVTSTAGFRNWRLPMIHYWRSFYRAILYDPAYPVRIICPKKRGDEQFHPINDCTFETGTNELMINHMGYAQRPEIVRYKQLTHGHRNQWRTDCNWFEDKFMANAQVDCHPVGSEYWNPEPVDPALYMPKFMLQHPYAQMEVIG